MKHSEFATVEVTALKKLVCASSMYLGKPEFSSILTTVRFGV
ncbi:hypothetical protein [Allocoleopsis sp.]